MEWNRARVNRENGGWTIKNTGTDRESNINGARSFLGRAHRNSILTLGDGR
jgi:hypothetical protein